jgi:hypothetical protein
MVEVEEIEGGVGVGGGGGDLRSSGEEHMDGGTKGSRHLHFHHLHSTLHMDFTQILTSPI